MGRRSVKENKSVYMLARESCGLTREQASEVIDGISPGRLEKLESGRTTMQPEDVVMLARAYKEPSLCNHYCARECAIGRGRVPILSEKSLPQIAIEMVNGINGLSEWKDRLLQIAEDGTVSEDENEDFSEIREMIDKLSLAADNLQLWLDKEEAQGR